MEKINQIGAGSQFILDAYPGASVAYSSRQLSLTATNAMRVRRSSDNSEQDIGFVDGELDTTSLLTFVGGSNGFITTWRDQTANGKDLVNSTASQQPAIATAGVLNTINSKPNFSFDTSSIGNLVSASSFSCRTGFVVYQIDSATTPTNQRLLFDSNDANNYIFQSASSLSFDGLGAEEARYAFNGAALSGYAENHAVSDRSGTQTLITFEYQSGDEETFDGIGYNSAFVINNMQELIIYPDDQTSNKSGIESNINSFFSIY